MSAVNARPFLVPSGGQRLSTTGTKSHASTPPRRRAFGTGPRDGPAGGPLGRRTSSARSVPNPSAQQPRNRVRSSDLSLASKIGTIPEAAEKRGTAAVDAAAVTISSPGRRMTAVRQPSLGNIATRRRPTVKSVSRRASTMKEILEQQTKQEERAEPIAEDNTIQAERQQRRKRGLNLGLAGDFFGAREKSAQDLFRGLPTLPGHNLCSDDGSDGNSLWASSNGSEQDFLMSCPVSKVDCFVSHTWARDRRDQMFRNSAEFTGFKAVELNNFLEDVASEKRASRRESVAFSKLDEMLMKVPTEPLVLWIDKFCVSPNILERRLVVERHMEHFLTNSDGFLALLSSCYFQRLWCVYEWGCFVATHGVSTLDRIRVCLSWLCASPTFQVPLLAHDIEMLSISSLKCSELNDQLFLRSTISEKFTSVQAFQRMVQISALCALAKSYAVLALDFITAGHPELEEAWRTKMSAEGGKVDDGSDLFCVSAPPRSRLRVIANSAAQMHLAALVRKARSAAVGAEGVAGAAMMMSAATVGQDGKGLSNNDCGVIREEGGQEHGSGSESSGSEEGREGRGRDGRFFSFASEAAW